MTDENLIEEAAKAAYEGAFLKHAPEEVDRWEDLLADNHPAVESWRDVARRVLAVFEKAHASTVAEGTTDDEREALRKRLSEIGALKEPIVATDDDAWINAPLDVVLDEVRRLGFRRAPESEKRKIEIHIQEPRCMACGQLGHNCPTGGRLLR